MTDVTENEQNKYIPFWIIHGKKGKPVLVQTDEIPFPFALHRTNNIAFSFTASRV